MWVNLTRAGINQLIVTKYPLTAYKYNKAAEYRAGSFAIARPAGTKATQVNKGKLPPGMAKYKITTELLAKRRRISSS